MSFYEGNFLPMRAGHVFFLRLFLMDSSSGMAMCRDESIPVRNNGVEHLGRHPRETGLRDGRRHPTYVPEKPRVLTPCSAFFEFVPNCF